MGANTGTWLTEGFEGFRAGTFGNGGQNLYVSRAGILQRIYQFDVNRDGYVDLVICNSQNHCERVPVDVYADLLGKPSQVQLPAHGARAATAADLNGDGYDDLVVGMDYDGIRNDLNAIIYYGSPEGLSERRQQRLPVPGCTAVAAGDFNGDSRIDLAFLSRGSIRIFRQNGLGFERPNHVDLPIPGVQIAAADLDGDGCADLIIADKEGAVRIYWGSPDGISPEHSTLLDAKLRMPASAGRSENYAEWVQEPLPRLQMLRRADGMFLTIPGQDGLHFVPVLPGRRFGESLTLRCPGAMAVAIGNLRGGSARDLAIACRERASGGAERSWIYWGRDGGYDDKNRTELPSDRACDVTVGDLDGDGRDEIVLCQGHTADSFTHYSPVLKVAPDRTVREVHRISSHSACRAILCRAPDRPIPDLAVVNHFSRNRIGNIPVSLYFGGPDGFAPERVRQLPAWGAVECLPCDIDDDGYPDLIIANASENSADRDPGSYIYRNGPDGFPAKPSMTLPTARAHGVCCADIDHDGYLDLIFCGFDNDEITIFRGGPGGFDTQHPERIKLEHEGKTYREPRWIHLADLNNDGWLELIVPMISYDRSFILWGGPDGFSMQRAQALAVTRGACARAADLTGNGWLDLIIGGHQPSASAPHDSFLHIYWNGPEGIREDRRQLLAANTINSIAVADFNNDGRRDLFICSYHDGRFRDIDSYVYWNRAGRGFAESDRTRIFTHSASGCFAADFNEDGYIDLAIANQKVWGDHKGESMVLWNSADGFDEHRVTRLPSSGPHGICSVPVDNQMDGSAEEYYTSAPHELPTSACVTRIRWDGEAPAKTWVRMQLRFAETSEGLAQASWIGPDDRHSWFEAQDASLPPRHRGRWVQYRLALGAVNGGLTPRLNRVRIDYENK